MTPFHQRRIEEEIKKEVSKIIGQELRDPRIGFITISRVSVTQNLHSAKVYITVFDSKKNDSTLFGLNNAKKHIRWLLAKRLRIRSVPELHFYIETSQF